MGRDMRKDLRGIRKGIGEEGMETGFDQDLSHGYIKFGNKHRVQMLAI